MSGVQIDQNSYEMPPRNLTHCQRRGGPTLAIMHGSSYTGDCARALGDLNVMYREVFGREKGAGASR